MDERHLKYLYTALAVLFGLPSLVVAVPQRRCCC